MTHPPPPSPVPRYRGELITNAVADKREREYEAAGMPDYMFRIDKQLVCDAQTYGAMARYVNHSCDPNCESRIFTDMHASAGRPTKKIALHAIRDIAEHEELCYDYKFSYEPDPARRIRCHCGAAKCRGWMNWDDKFDRTGRVS